MDIENRLTDMGRQGEEDGTNGESSIETYTLTYEARQGEFAV